jgi:hypothetical protein
VVLLAGEHDGVQRSVELTIAASIKAMPYDLARGRLDRCGAAQGGEGGLRAQPADVGPGVDDLRGADHAHARLGQQLGHEPDHELLELGLQVVGLGLQRERTPGGTAQAGDGRAMLDRLAGAGA